MKWSVKQLTSQLNQAGKLLPPLVLVYGDDGGAVREHGQSLVAYTDVPLDDPFCSDKISVEDLQERSGALLEAAGTMSFGGGLRLIRVEGVRGDLPAGTLTAVTQAVKACLSAELKDVVIVIAAPQLDKSSALVRAVENHKQAAAVRCFQDNSRNIGDLVRSIAAAAGKTVTPEALALLTENLGADRAITQLELEKLMLYAGEAPQIDREAVLASLAGAPAVNVFKLCDALGQRDVAKVDRYLNLLEEEGQDLNQTLSLIQRHLKRLLLVRQSIDSGQSPDAAMKALRPPVMFGQPEFLQQARSYPLARLIKVAGRVVETQTQSRQGAVPPNLALKRSILALAS